MSPAWPAQRFAWASLGVLVLVGALAGAYFSMRPAEVGKQPAQGGFVFPVHPAPRALAELAFEDGGGRKRSLADFRGKTVLLNVWATWCVPCREEMPALDRVQQKLGGPTFEVLALSIDSGGSAAVRRFYEDLGIRSLAVYVDSTMRATQALRTVGVPTTVLVDRQGREIGRLTGPAQWDGPEAMRLIEAQLNKAKP